MVSDKSPYSPGWRTRKNEIHRSRQVGKYTNVLKFALPLVSGIILSFIFIWPRIKHLQFESSVSPIEKRLKENPKLANRLINPVFESLDKNGQAFSIKANSALVMDPKCTNFEKPKGRMNLKDGSTLSFWADTGQHYKDSNILDLVGNVHLITDKGYNLLTHSAQFHLASNKGSGHDSIYGTGPNNETIHAQGFEISEKGDVFNFTGKVKITLPTK